MIVKPRMITPRSASRIVSIFLSVIEFDKIKK